MGKALHDMAGALDTVFGELMES